MSVSSNKYSDQSFKLNLGDLVYSKTFEEEMEEQRKIELAIGHLEGLGVEVKSEYGYYRNIYNVLKDLGECLDNMDKKILIEELISTINEEIDQSPSTAHYLCSDGTIITTDVGYVYDWFRVYADVLRNRYCTNEAFTR